MVCQASKSWEVGTDHLRNADVLLVDTKKNLSLYKDGEAAKSVTPCCASGSGCGPTITASGRKELDYDLNEWICKSVLRIFSIAF
jgi:hypothetical protein